MNEKDYGGEIDLWNRWVLSPKWKTDEVTDSEGEERDCGQWGNYVRREVSQQKEVDRMKEEADSTGKERLVICNEEDTDGLARVTTDKEQVLPVDWTEISLCR